MDFYKDISEYIQALDWGAGITNFYLHLYFPFDKW